MEFLSNTNVFKDMAIDEDEHEKTLQGVDSWEGNPMLKGVVTLEIFFLIYIIDSRDHLTQRPKVWLYYMLKLSRNRERP